MATFAGVIVRRLSNFTNVYNRMETTNKKIRGSAFVDDEGLFVFTPYATVDPEKRSLKLVFAGRYATAWVGKRRVCVRFSWTGVGQKCTAGGQKRTNSAGSNLTFYTSCRRTAVPKASFGVCKINRSFTYKGIFAGAFLPRQSCWVCLLWYIRSQHKEINKNGQLEIGDRRRSILAALLLLTMWAR